MANKLTFFVETNETKVRSDVILGGATESFVSFDEALFRYIELASMNSKTLGISDGEMMLPLVRNIRLFPDDVEGEDILDIEELFATSLSESQEVRNAIKRCVTALKLRYYIKDNVLAPLPQIGTSTKHLDGIRLRPSSPADISTAIQWIYVAGKGLVSSKEFTKLQEKLPLVPHVLADCITDTGVLITMELKPWEFEKLAQSHKKEK